MSYDRTEKINTDCQYSAVWSNEIIMQIQYSST